MKIGINLFLWTDFVEQSHFRYIEELKEAGYDGVEIPLFQGDEKHYTKLGQFIRDLDMECTTTSACLPDKNLISRSPKFRQAGVDHLKWAVDMTAALGAQLIGGPLHSSPGIFTDYAPTDLELDFAAQGLQEVADSARKDSIVLAIEYLNRFESHLINSVEQSKELVLKIDRENVGIHYDTHHAHLEEYCVYQAILDGGNCIRHVQLSESNRGIPGKGQVNWAMTFGALQKINYDGWLTIEAFNRHHSNLRKNLFLWRELYKEPKDVYEAGIKLLKDFGLYKGEKFELFQ